MAIAFVGSTTHATSDDWSSLEFDHTVPSGSDRLLLVAVTLRDFERTGGVSYAGIPLSCVWRDSPSSLVRVELWAMVAPPVGTAAVRVDAYADISYCGCAAALSYDGVDQTGPIGGAASSVGSSGTDLSVVVNTAGAASLVVGVKGGYGGDTYPHTPGDGVVERVDIQSGTSTTADHSLFAGELPAPIADAYTFGVAQNASDRYALLALELLATGQGIPRGERVTQAVAEVDGAESTHPRATQAVAEVDVAERAAMWTSQVVAEVDILEIPARWRVYSCRYQEVSA